MIQYRPFHNTDPPKLVKLWHACQLGRGAAEHFSYDALEEFAFAQPYFDRNGLIIAHDGDRIVGCAHAGFGCDEQQEGLSFDAGVICLVLVHPAHRRKGIGKRLVSLAEAYLRAAGASEVYAGPAEPRDPFYFGLYGGSQPAGFLDSDTAAAPFFEALGYEPVERHLVFQRSLAQDSDPVSVRLVTIRRKMELKIVSQPPNPTWWWGTRLGRLDTLRFLLVPKGGGPPVAAVSAVGLDLYLAKWGERSIGLLDLYVAETERRKGYAQALLVEVGRPASSRSIRERCSAAPSKCRN